MPNVKTALFTLIFAIFSASCCPLPGCASGAQVPSPVSRLTLVKLPSGLHPSVSAPSESHVRSFETGRIDCGLAADQFIFSWNTSPAFPRSAGLRIAARAIYPNHTTGYYRIADWSLDNSLFPRQSMKNQKDADGDVFTDTLALKLRTRFVQIRVSLSGLPDSASAADSMLKLLTICATDTESQHTVASMACTAPSSEITVPGRTQLGWPDAAGWCSPTSTDMVLAYWANRLKRPELDMPVPDVAHAIYDPVYDGTGNWPFNTAFAGSFPGMFAFVSRLSNISELERWPKAGLPIIVSVSYDLLKGKDQPLDAGHLMVCVGFTREGDIVLNDPAHHPEAGEPCRRVFPRSNFLKAWANSKNTVYVIYAEGTTLPPDPDKHWH